MKKIPDKPKLSEREVSILGLSAFSIVIFILILLSVFQKRDISFLSAIGLAITASFGFLPLYAVLSQYLSDRKAYKESPEDFPAYKKKQLEELSKESQELQRHMNEQERRIEEKRQAELAKLPACPICGKKDNVVRISTLNRTTSVAAFGLASSKIGKQYKCKNCKHMW